jgi:hypothetical protein
MKSMHDPALAIEGKDREACSLVGWLREGGREGGWEGREDGEQILP